jgi:hypothetical protein
MMSDCVGVKSEDTDGEFEQDPVAVTSQSESEHEVGL